MIDLDLLRVLVVKNLRMRYRSAVFGYLWAAAAPLMSAAIYAAAFGALGVRRPPIGWGAFLVGVAAWHWIAGVLGHSTTLYLRNLNLLRRLPVRWTNHALACVLVEAAPVAAILPLAAAYGILQGDRPPLSALVLLPLLAAAQAAALAGWASAAGAANVFVSDFERLSGPFAAALFFATPVAYDPSVLPPALQAWLALNPAAVFVEAWRGAFNGNLEAPLLAAALLHAVFGLTLAAAVERLCARRLAEYA